MRVLMCGDRRWSDVSKISAAFDRFQPTVVIEGEAPGADTLARLEAEKRGIKIDAYPAFWEVYGKSAGPIRNAQMLDEGMPDLVVAFHSNLAESKGTRDMVRRAKKAGIEVIVVE